MTTHIIFGYCEKKNSKGLNALIRSGVNVNVKDHGGKNPLHNAACHNSVECMEVLIEAGLDIEEKTYDGKTPLHYSVECRSLECLYLLLKAGADINAKTIYGNTPLHRVVQILSAPTLPFIKILLEYGADPTIKNNVGKTFLEYIRNASFRKEIEECVQELSTLDIKEPSC